MEVERNAAVNKDQDAEENCQAVITDPPKCGREKGPGVEDKELHAEARQPENRDHRADRAGEGTRRGEFIDLEKRQGSKRNDHEDDEDAVDPKKPAEKRMQRREIFSPV